MDDYGRVMIYGEDMSYPMTIYWNSRFVTLGDNLLKAKELKRRQQGVIRRTIIKEARSADAEQGIEPVYMFLIDYLLT